MANIFNINSDSIKDNNVQNDVDIQQIPGLNAAAAFNIVGSVASEENALAAIIQEEADKLSLLTGAALTFANFTDLAESITRTMKTVLLKNTVLEAKLTETLNYIENEPSFIISPVFVDNLIAILARIANEENALGNLIRALGNAVRLLAPALSLAQLQAVDQIVISLLRVITEKNLVLLSKLRRLVRFIVNNSDSFPTPTAAQVAATIAAINSLITSITVEENGLAVLIEGEAAKLNRAVALTTSAAGIPGLLAFNNTITSVIDIVVQKNMILEAKLEDILALLALGFTPAQLAVFAATLSNLQQSIANEEFSLAALIGTEALKINAIAEITPGNIGNLVAVNDSATTLLESITLKNMILQQKNLEVINFILSL
ncbi:MAG: hypothetical protein VB128_06530 [Sedimentibacter saalensis]|uniref:hypothetical protein n=1 Tax=Sedimentibacter saalensis TaxID=130788 RepID=UPI002B20E24E|nr:hypothetical protein [Sedimentibacter saalensis]MEA5094588.1 hypothetical protein [Sedimentibacter saalensis]